LDNGGANLVTGLSSEGLAQVKVKPLPLGPDFSPAIGKRPSFMA